MNQKLLLKALVILLLAFYVRIDKLEFKCRRARHLPQDPFASGYHLYLLYGVSNCICLLSDKCNAIMPRQRREVRRCETYGTWSLRDAPVMWGLISVSRFVTLGGDVGMRQSAHEHAEQLLRDGTRAAV